MKNNALPSILIVKPSSAIRADYKNFSDMCHATQDPVLITNNGENDLVVMSHEAFCRREAWFSLQSKLAEADRQMGVGQLTDHDEVFKRLQERINHE